MESGLTLSSSYAPGETITNSVALNTNTVFVCDVVLPSTYAQDCTLFENGGESIGAYVGVRDVASGVPKLRVRGGSGKVAPPAADIVFVDVFPIPADGRTHEIAFEFRTTAPAGVRVWIDGTLYGHASGSFYSDQWSGAGSGSFGRVESSFVVGESSNPWPVQLTKPLRRYDNQLGWLSAAEARLGSPDYTYSGPSTFPSLILDKSAMFSMEAVIPTSFASSCLLFDYGGTLDGLYVGVVRSLSDGSTVLRVVSNSISTMDFPDFPMDGRWHNIAFSIQQRVNNTDTSRVWIDGVLKATSTGELGAFLSGTDGGGFGLVNNSVINGGDGTPWPSSLRTLRIYLNETGSLPSFGALSFADLAQEYGLSTTQPVALNSFYQNRPAIAAEIWDTRSSDLARKAFVGRLGSPSVPVGGSLPLLAFRGGRRQPPASARTIVTVPPQMSEFFEDVATPLLEASFANTTQAQMEAGGWTFSTSNALSFQSEFAKSNGSGTISSPPLIDTLSGVGSVSWTLYGSSLEGNGGETVTFLAQDASNGNAIDLAKVDFVATSTTYTYDLRDLDAGVVDIYNPKGVRLIAVVSMGVADLYYLQNFSASKIENYVCAASTNRAGYLSAWKVFDMQSDTYWNSDDGRYNITSGSNDGSPRTMPSMNAFNDGILGEFISLRIPWPMYLTSYEMTGNCTDWVVYGSVDGRSFDVLDTQIGIASESLTTNRLITPAVSPSEKAYTIFVAKFTRMERGAHNRGQMHAMNFKGFRA
eukprot:gene10922-biopygen11000